MLDFKILIGEGHSINGDGSAAITLISTSSVGELTYLDEISSLNNEILNNSSEYKKKAISYLWKRLFL